MEFSLTSEQITGYLITYGIKILSALGIFIIGRFLLDMVIGAVKKLMANAHVDDTLISFSSNMLGGIGLTFIIVTALNQLGIETTSIAAAIAAAGLAIGLALQGSLSNFASGVMLIIFKPFKLGDYVEAGDAAGTVSDISIFTTTFKTIDNKTVIIPNGSITSGNITNYSTEATRRVDLVVGVSYDADLKQTKEVLMTVLNNDPDVLDSPKPLVAVKELADNSVNLVVRPWVKTENYWPTYYRVTENIKNELDKAGIGIPYPQRDLHIISGSLTNN